MVYYFECFIFFIISTVIMYLFGTALFYNKDDNVSARLVYGFIIHEFLIAIAGLPIQVLKLPYIIFYVYVILLDAGILFFSIYRIRKNKISLLPENKIEIIKNNWFVIIILCILMFMSLSYVSNYWMGNMQDDGYYLNKTATIPYIQDSFSTNPSTGYEMGFSTYTLMTGELESSVYANILHMDASIYLRLFLSAFRFFIYLNIILAFISKIYKDGKFKFDKSLLQYCLLIVLLFDFPMNFLIKTKLLRLQDSWQFNSAMYYGSMLIRTTGLFALIYPFIDKEEIKIKDVFIYFIISIVMLTKSIVALPAVILIGMSYLMAHYLLEGNKKQKIIVLLLILVIIIVSLILKDINYFDKHIINIFKWHLTSIPFLLATVGFVSGFFLKSKTVNKINLSIIILLLTMIIDPLNNILSTVSVHLFVAARTQTMFMYIIMILGFSYLCINLFSIVKRNKNIIFIIVNLFLVILVLFCFVLAYENEYNDKIERSYKIIRMNKHFMPNSTIRLGQKLEKLSKEENININLMVPLWSIVDGYQHSLAVLLRTYAPNVNVLTAVVRYGGGQYKGFNSDDYNTYMKFILKPNKKTYEKFKDLIERYPTNCIVVDNDKKDEYLTNLGFSLYEKVEDKTNEIVYYIYYKK